MVGLLVVMAKSSIRFAADVLCPLRKTFLLELYSTKADSKVLLSGDSDIPYFKSSNFWAVCSVQMSLRTESLNNPGRPAFSEFSTMDRDGRMIVVPTGSE
ncbi:hypothetical protein OGATHE_006169 [Ogataea polymorpha]|uniref:Uncharacterized protein n=1 Tax=Ogataea polymorpha TaxID=460523 RepID=A0A9P8SYY1_9ASCO|nr:hypothetical protein OGATHE_006169 [Ogataea polymorpha]